VFLNVFVYYHLNSYKHRVERNALTLKSRGAAGIETTRL